MTHNTNTPKFTAKVVRRANGGEWCDAEDFQPVEIPVEAFEGSAGPYLTDVFDGTVYGLVGALIEADTDALVDYDLVWSDSGFSVKGLCPGCDDVFPVAEGVPGDVLNEGYDAVCCGCADF